MHGLLQEPPEEHLFLSILSFQNFYSGICLYLAQLSVKLVICWLSFVCYHCLEYVRLDDTLAIRKRLCCLLRVCVETVVSILFWWFNKGILLLVSTNNHLAWLWDDSTIYSGTAVHFACLRCWEKCCWYFVTNNSRLRHQNLLEVAWSNATILAVFVYGKQIWRSLCMESRSTNVFLKYLLCKITVSDSVLRKDFFPWTV